MYYIEILQLNRDRYFWILKYDEVLLAFSHKIAPKDVIEQETEKVAVDLNLPIVVNERS